MKYLAINIVVFLSMLERVISTPDHQQNIPSTVNILIDIPSFGRLAEQKYTDLDSANLIFLDKLKQQKQLEAINRERIQDSIQYKLDQDNNMKQKQNEVDFIKQRDQFVQQYESKVKQILKENKQS